MHRLPGGSAAVPMSGDSGPGNNRPGNNRPGAADGKPGRIRLTPLRDLGVAVMLGGLAAWLLVRTVEAVTGSSPLLPWAGPLALWFVAALVAGTAWVAHVKLRVRKERIEPERGVAFLVLGKAAALGGAMIAGGYLIFALLFVDRWEADEPRMRVIRGLVAAAAGVVTCVCARVLERACRIDEDDSDGGSPA